MNLYNKLLGSLYRSILYFLYTRYIVSNNTTSIYTTLKKQKNNENVKAFLKNNNDNAFLDAIDDVSDIKVPKMGYMEYRL